MRPVSRVIAANMWCVQRDAGRITTDVLTRFPAIFSNRVTVTLPAEGRLDEGRELAQFVFRDAERRGYRVADDPQILCTDERLISHFVFDRK